jgi:hypothetical protein
MPDVIATPTISKIITDSSLSKEELEEFREKNIPVLCVRALLPSSFTIDQVKTAIQPIDKTVHINPDERHILIGTKEDSLINTDNLKDNEQTKQFFLRWTETKNLFLAFNCFSKGLFVCCIKGLWIENKWEKFEFQKNFTISTLY